MPILTREYGHSDARIHVVHEPKSFGGGGGGDDTCVWPATWLLSSTCDT